MSHQSLRLSVAEFLPNFEPRVRQALRQLLSDGESKIKLGLAKDGSGVGGGCHDGSYR